VYLAWGGLTTRERPARRSARDGRTGWAAPVGAVPPGTSVGRPRWSRIRQITRASSMIAISRSRPWHRGHASTSNPKLRCISCAHSRFGGLPDAGLLVVADLEEATDFELACPERASGLVWFATLGGRASRHAKAASRTTARTAIDLARRKWHAPLEPYGFCGFSGATGNFS
jgi:hypothetical protein